MNPSNAPRLRAAPVARRSLAPPLRLAAALAVLALSACGHEKGPPAGTSAAWSADPQSIENPWPDSRLGPGVGVRPRWYAPFVPASASSRSGFTGLFDGWKPLLARLDGFGAYAPTLVRFSGAVEESSLAGAFEFVKADGSRKVDASVEYEPSISDEPFALVRPKLALPSGDAWILALTDAAKDSTGKPLVRSADYWRKEQKPDAPLAAAAAALGVGAGHVLLALPFTTSTQPAELATLAPKLEALRPPAPDLAEQLTVSGNAPPRGVFTPGSAQCTDTAGNAVDCFAGAIGLAAGWSDTLAHCGAGATPGACHVGAIVSGSYPSHDLRKPYVGTNHDTTSDDGLFDPALLADPASAPTMDVPFLVAVPTGTPPAGGWPVVVVGHGFGGDYRFVLDMAETLNASGVAVAGITHLMMGDRGNFAEFIDVQKLLRTREFIRQTAVDQQQLVTLLANFASASGHGELPLDAARIGYFGQSWGGITGATLMSIEARIGWGVLNVPGGGIIDIADLGSYHGLVSLLLGALAGAGADSPQVQGTWPLLVAVGQEAIDAADPIHFIGHARGPDRFPHLPADRRILVQWAVSDQTVNNATTAALLAQGAIPALSATASDAGGVTGSWRYVVTDYLPGTTNDPHGMLNYIPQVRAQLAAYLASDGTQVEAESP